MRSEKAAYLFLIPAVMFFCISAVIPFFSVGRLSLFKTNFIQSTFVGLSNFTDIFKDTDFIRSIGNSFLFVIFQIPVQLGVAIVIALTIFNLRKWIQDYVRFALYIPVFTVGIISATVWRWIYDYQDGLANYLLSLIRVEPVFWLGTKMGGIVAIATVMIFTSTGWGVLIYLSAITSISKEIFDSALIDGASWLQVKLRIILPLIFPTIAFITLFSMIGVFQMWETIYMMTGGGPMRLTQNMMYNIYHTGFLNSHYGMASAKSLVLMAIVFLTALVKNRIEKRV